MGIILSKCDYHLEADALRSKGLVSYVTVRPGSRVCGSLRDGRVCVCVLCAQCMGMELTAELGLRELGGETSERGNRTAFSCALSFVDGTLAKSAFS